MASGTWFYHAPAKREYREQMAAPPPSQIPGLSHGQDGPEEETRKNWIKEDDSAYIRLAKQGGRPDLLRFRSPKPHDEGPKGYPRCEWYYDGEGSNQPLSRTESREDYEFLLPDYMVHQEPASRERGSAGSRRRAPFAHDNDQVYTRDHDTNPTDKTVKLPELKPSGYGTRATKMEGIKSRHMVIERPKPVIHDSELSQGKMKYAPVPRENSIGSMDKLMSNGYNSEWQANRDEWQRKQKKIQDKFDTQNPQAQNNFQTEYQTSIGPNQRSNRGQPKPAAGTTSSKPTNTTEDKELFKMSKFKNVSAKTSSYRRDSRGSNPIVHDLEPNYVTVQ